MKILIFENDKIDLQNIKDCIDKYFLSNSMNYSVDICTCETQLLNDFDKYDLLFLDIELDGLNGIELGLKLTGKQSNCEIIIVSNYMDYLIDGYKINAKRYFIKPINQMNFNIEMDAVIKKIHQKNEGFYDDKISNHKILFKDIMYIEFVDRKSEIHLVNGEIIYSSYPLKYWTQFLKEHHFGLSHRSYLINYMYVHSIEDQNIVILNQEKIPLSRNNKKEFKKEYVSSLHLSL